MKPISTTERHAQILAEYLKGKTWTSMDECAEHLRLQCGETMTHKIACRRVQEAKRHTMRSENRDAVIIASDDIAAGKMGYKIAESPQELEAYISRFVKKMLAVQENIANLDFHFKRFVNKDKAKLQVFS